MFFKLIDFIEPCSIKKDKTNVLLEYFIKIGDKFPEYKEYIDVIERYILEYQEDTIKKRYTDNVIDRLLDNKEYTERMDSIVSNSMTSITDQQFIRQIILYFQYNLVTYGGNIKYEGTIARARTKLLEEQKFISFGFDKLLNTVRIISFPLQEEIASFMRAQMICELGVMYIDELTLRYSVDYHIQLLMLHELLHMDFYMKYGELKRSADTERDRLYISSDDWSSFHVTYHKVGVLNWEGYFKNEEKYMSISMVHLIDEIRARLYDIEWEMFLNKKKSLDVEVRSELALLQDFIMRIRAVAENNLAMCIKETEDKLLTMLG